MMSLVETEYLNKQLETVSSKKTGNYQESDLQFFCLRL